MLLTGAGQWAAGFRRRVKRCMTVRQSGFTAAVLRRRPLPGMRVRIRKLCRRTRKPLRLIQTPRERFRVRSPGLNRFRQMPGALRRIPPGKRRNKSLRRAVPKTGTRPLRLKSLPVILLIKTAPSSDRLFFFIAQRRKRNSSSRAAARCEEGEESKIRMPGRARRLQDIVRAQYIRKG